jgi:hypothetical protein
MTRQPISFDCDGVIAEGAWVPACDRSNSEYFKKQPIPGAIENLVYLSMFYDIFIVSARCHKDANLGLRAWLTFACCMDMSILAGVITPPPDLALQGPDAHYDKQKVLKYLGVKVHFDDDPRQIPMGTGILFPSTIPVEEGLHPILPTWNEIRWFLTTPHARVQGRNSWSRVTSPASEEFLLAPPPNVPLEDLVVPGRTV